MDVLKKKDFRLQIHIYEYAINVKVYNYIQLRM